MSVIVAVYNVERFVAQCIQSLLNQTYTNFELILINDGSTDKSGQICDEWVLKDSRILVIHQQNKGMSNARNSGLSRASGDLITFVDSDDFVTPQYLYDLYDALEDKNEFGGLVIEGFKKHWSDKKFQEIHIPDLYLLPNDYFKVVTELIDKNILYVCAKLFDHKLIQLYNIRFVSGVSGLEDMFFTLDYILHSKYVIIRDRINYIYRVGHSDKALSVYIFDFDREYLAFLNFRDRIDQYKALYSLSEEELKKAWVSLTVTFHKVLLSIYKKRNGYSFRQRLSFLNKISKDKKWLRRNFLPQYKADQVGKFLLCYIGAVSFDLWMSFLIKIKFKRRFGA